MIDLDHSAGRAQRLLLGYLLHRQDRAHRNVLLVANVHDLELGHGLGPLLDGVEDMPQPRQPRWRRRIIRIGLPFRRLGDEINVSVGIALPALALENPARLAAAGIIAGPRRCLAERNTFAMLAVFGEWAMSEPLLVAQFHAREIEHAILHGAEHFLTPAGPGSLIKRCDDAKRQMKPRP